ncbi:asparagine synthase (glutamine-hydrolyzing) [Bradyrhizobium diazoefficiens]|nr:asparagine synthase (glutamine-hydrolyzing) [Bradyrhizobium diazoefficiens]APO51400.1 asparagine synthetase B [Bradyrhizobium diazoefficiens]KOY06268.1 asparagine synthetase [Bradyrhizobium diazoefficiens]MCD9293255.1 asparagine synthase (glutamine-hydrolyzing) [Bradyrhizobium diazoefficiens]MCD9815384.1 asparagine synthase (glutamine-hydrolyzing) [Bradyrhizobium diazoefficiens]MCD9829758.1 asparagine synthase (glutamine-hydrolyzing) [Bradyrhizobium diazoefficiens]
MCGIFGWALGAAKRQDRKTLIDLTDRMFHRGPDGSGYWLQETSDERFQIGFGHRRLSIIDIGGGGQPMSSEDGRFTLIFNGEIYNYLELRQELVALGHRFRTNSDTEVLIEAFRAWHFDAVGRFRGMFGFALWDEAEQRLVLARDAFGKKPLFLAELQGGLLFGSEIEPLVRFPGFSRAFDSEALGHYLLNRYVPGPLTFFRAVRKLQPGHYAVWQNGTLKTTRYFTPPVATTVPDVKSFGDAVRLFEGTFDEAVRIRMRSDAPFGAYLSGGVDSSAVVATMVKHSTGPVRTFSVGFREVEYSELDHARAVAGQFGTFHNELFVEPDAFMEHWSTAVLRRGAPVSETSDVPIFMLSEMASSSVKMVLTGEGADELMGGYAKHRAERWIGLYQWLMPHLLHERVIHPLVRSLPYGMRRVKILALAAGERDLVNRMRVWFGGTSVAEAEAMLGRRLSAAPPDVYPYSSGLESSLRRALFFDQTSWLPDDLLERGDRMMMAGSIEGRMPFMDTMLAGVVARFPDEFLTGGKGGKTVLRAAMDKILPQSILRRKKVGFRVPVGEWFRGPYQDFVQDMLVSESSSVARMISGSKLRRLVAEHLSGRQNHEKVLWSMINLEMFLRTFKIST